MQKERRKGSDNVSGLMYYDKIKLTRNGLIIKMVVLDVLSKKVAFELRPE